MVELFAIRSWLLYKVNSSILAEEQRINKGGAVLLQVTLKEQNAILVHQLQVSEDQVSIVVD